MGLQIQGQMQYLQMHLNLKNLNSPTRFDEKLEKTLKAGVY